MSAEIMDALRKLYAQGQRIEKRLDWIAEMAKRPAAPVGPVDDGADRDVTKDPPRWKGAKQAPCRMSECPPEYLDELAGFLRFKADNPREGKEKYAQYDALDAVRAAGWAARARAKPADESAPEEI